MTDEPTWAGYARCFGACGQVVDSRTLNANSRCPQCAYWDQLSGEQTAPLQPVGD